jgi:hypothetical protein
MPLILLGKSFFRTPVGKIDKRSGRPCDGLPGIRPAAVGGGECIPAGSRQQSARSLHVGILKYGAIEKFDMINRRDCGKKTAAKTDFWAIQFGE